MGADYRQAVEFFIDAHNFNVTPTCSETPSVVRFDVR